MKMKIGRSVALLIFIPDLLCAEDIEIGGKVYKDYKVTSHTKTGITIVHSTGIATIPAQSLPEALREKYNLDLDEAQAAEERKAAEIEIKKIRKAQQDYLENSALIVAGVVFQVVDEGILLEHGLYTTGEKEEIKKTVRVKIDGPTKLNPHRKEQFVTRKLPSEYKLVTKSFNQNVFVYCDTENLIDGADWGSVIWPFGTFSYTNVTGSRKTVASYATSPTGALEFAVKRGLLPE